VLKKLVIDQKNNYFSNDSQASKEQQIYFD